MAARRAVDGKLMAEYMDVRFDRKDVLRGLGSAEGCLDEARRQELRARRVSVSVLVASDDCNERTIFSFTVRADLLGSLATLPWIVNLESESGHGPG